MLIFGIDKSYIRRIVESTIREKPSLSRGVMDGERPLKLPPQSDVVIQRIWFLLQLKIWLETKSLRAFQTDKNLIQTR